MNNTLLFEMRGCRSVLRLAGAAIHMQQQIDTIEAALGNNPSLVFDLAKALVETVCKTILNDRKLTFDNNYDLQRLFKYTVENLELLPSDHSNAKKSHQGLIKATRGLLQAVQGIAELRNEQGMASHGKDAYARPIDTAQALLVAQAADTIVHFLYSVHLDYRSDLVDARLVYNHHSEFNNYVDDLHGIIQIFEGTYSPSEVLFEMDNEAYRAGLAEYQSLQQTEVISASQGEETE